MSRLLCRGAVVATVSVALASLAAVGVTAPASGENSSAPPAITSELPTSLNPTGPGFSRAQAPTRAESAAVATTGSDHPDARSPESTGAVAESVIPPGDQRVQVPGTASSTFPLSAIGQIEFSINGGSFICTGWLIDDNSILTSGHCSYEEGQVIDSAQFFAGRNRENGVVSNPFGSCDVTSVFAPPQWINDSNPSFDYSVQQLGDTPGVCTVGQAAGHFGMFSLPGTNAFHGRRLRVEGYPGDKPFGGRWMMAGLADHSTTQNIFYRMDTFGGNSGSPLFKFNRPSCGGPCGAGVHSYGSQHTPALPTDTNSGPRLTPARINGILDVADNNGG